MNLFVFDAITSPELGFRAAFLEDNWFRGFESLNSQIQRITRFQEPSRRLAVIVWVFQI